MTDCLLKDLYVYLLVLHRIFQSRYRIQFQTFVHYTVHKFEHLSSTAFLEGYTAYLTSLKSHEDEQPKEQFHYDVKHYS